MAAQPEIDAGPVVPFSDLAAMSNDIGDGLKLAWKAGDEVIVPTNSSRRRNDLQIDLQIAKRLAVEVPARFRAAHTAHAARVAASRSSAPPGMLQ